MCLQLLLPITADDSSSSTNVGNSGLVAKRKAQRAEKERFEESHAAAFDEYGRTLRYGTTVGDIKCELTAAMGQWRCSVVDFEVRKYLTKEEQTRAKQIRLDKQEELDSGGATTEGRESAVKKKVRQREEQARCETMGEWLVAYAKDASENHAEFFKQYLTGAYEDYNALRRIAEKRRGIGKADQKKAAKLKRHIALTVHTDKIPERCRGDDELRAMLSDVLAHCERLQECINNPSDCAIGAGIGAEL